MFALFPFGCFGVHKKRKKPGNNMKEVFESGSLEPFKPREEVELRQDEVTPLNNATGSNEDVKQNEPSSACSEKPEDVQEVKTGTVLVEGIKCRSQLKCKARPGGYVGPRCCVALRGTQA